MCEHEGLRLILRVLTNIGDSGTRKESIFHCLANLFMISPVKRIRLQRRTLLIVDQLTRQETNQNHPLWAQIPNSPTSIRDIHQHLIDKHKVAGFDVKYLL